MSEEEAVTQATDLTESAARDCLDYLKLVDSYLFSTRAPDKIFFHTLDAQACMDAMIDRIWPGFKQEEFIDDGSF